ncbi:hypothetical protein K469DRAFT_454887, partial [Zopfia rhizophila CBS 207.26]
LHLQIITLHEIGWSNTKIREQFQRKGTEIMPRQIHYMCSARHPTPPKRDSRSDTCNEEKTDELFLFICSSQTNHLLSYPTLA